MAGLSPTPMAPERPQMALRRAGKAQKDVDLSKTYPRSPRAKLAGLVMLARTADKARANNGGTPGVYHFGCGMDRHVLGFLGTEPEAFAKTVAQLSTDDRIATWALERLKGKSAADVDRFNAEFAQDAPAPGSDGELFFRGERERLGRADIATWFDLLDADEGREVPHPVAA